jgi:hypothetical protein
MRNPIAVTNISRRKLNAACTTGWLSIFHIDSKPNYQETLEPPTHHPMQFGSPKSSSLWSDSSYSLTLSQNQQSPEKTGMLVDSPLHAGNWMPEELDAGRTGCRKNWRPEELEARITGFRALSESIAYQLPLRRLLIWNPRLCGTFPLTKSLER